MDRYLRISRRVFASYERALSRQRIQNVLSEVRLDPRGVTEHDEVTVTLRAARPRPGDGFEFAAVVLPVRFVDLAVSAQATTALNVAHQTLLRLADLRGWDTHAVTVARDEALAEGLACASTTGWRWSPDRRLKARVHGYITDDGWGRTSVEVQTSAGEVLLQTPDEVSADCSYAGMRQQRTAIRWTSATTLQYYYAFTVTVGGVGDPQIDRIAEPLPLPPPVIAGSRTEPFHVSVSLD